MNEEAFRRIVERAWEGVPEKFKQRVDNVALLVEDEPSADVRKEEGLGEGDTLLGLYRGIPAAERGELYGIGGTLPDTITLYRLPLLEEAERLMEARNLPYEEAVAEAVRETVWHEVGHYFGLREHEVQHREDEGTNRFHI